MQEPQQAVPVAQQESRALVERKAAGESDHQRALGGHIGSQSVRSASAEPGIDPQEQARALSGARRPQLGQVALRQRSPALRLVRHAPPIAANRPVKEPAHVGAHPRSGVHAVGDRIHLGRWWHVAHGQADTRPHLLTHHAVKLADAVAARSRTQRQRGHAEPFRIIGGVGAAEPHELLVVEPEHRAKAGQVGFDQLRRKDVVARGYGGVRRERQPRSHLQERFVERVGQAGYQPLAGQLEGGEGGMALIHM